jgi:hypothetical protein
VLIECTERIKRYHPPTIQTYSKDSCTAIAAYSGTTRFRPEILSLPKTEQGIIMDSLRVHVLISAAAKSGLFKE